MKMNDCIWEDGKFKGTSDSGYRTELEASKVADADELRLKLSYGQKNVSFRIEKVAGGFYSSVWTWEIEGEDRLSPPAKTCHHEWVNQGFHHIIMACKHCGEDAPSWVEKKA